jgi:hypothetical protein
VWWGCGWVVVSDVVGVGLRDLDVWIDPVDSVLFARIPTICLDPV